VKFKKIVDFNPKVEDKLDTDDSQAQGEKENWQPHQPNGGNAKPSTDSGNSIEEKIHINYRLQYLRDSVMATYIDDQTVNVINQLITANNREIVTFIFESGDNAKSLKDQIVDKIKNKDDIHIRH
jgi:hypothetical protein